MIQVVSVVALMALFAPISSAATLNPLEDLKQAHVQQAALGSCALSIEQTQCLEAVEFFRSWDVEKFSEHIEQIQTLVKQAIAKDEAKLHQLEEMISISKAGHHYQQIVAYGKLKLQTVQKHMYMISGIIPDVKMFVKTANLADSKYSAILKEKLIKLESHIRLSLDSNANVPDQQKTQAIIRNAEKGSLIEYVPASNEKTSGMLPFYCDDRIRFCEDELVVRFDVGILKKILGDGPNPGMVVIDIRKLGITDFPVVQVFSSMFNGMTVDEKLKFISVSYYDSRRCGEDGMIWILSDSLCDKKVITKRMIEPRENIEAALFHLIGETDESLKLYARPSTN